MKLLCAFLLIIFLPISLFAQQPDCILPDGTACEVKYKCDPATIEKFANRFYELLPKHDQEKNAVESLKGLYPMAIYACEGSAVSMTPEEIGKNGEPFFTWQFTAAMAQAARDVFCPEKF